MFREPPNLKRRIERIYLRVPRFFRAFTQERILPAYRPAVSQMRRDAPSDDMRDILNELDRQVTEELAVSIERELTEWITRLDESNRDHYQETVIEATEIDISPVTEVNEFENEIKADIEANVALVTGLTAEMRKTLGRVIFNGLQENMSARELAREIDEALGITRRRALLIARDQMAKISGTLDKLRQTALGIEHYIWRDSDDERVRASHEEVDGKVFRWDTEVPNGLVRPGFEINCRCKAQAHIVFEGANR